MRGRKVITKKSFSIFSGNSNGLKSKLFSLDNIVSDLRPAVIGIQETHFQKNGQIKIPSLKNYQVYEHLRNDKSGGGLALCVINDLDPVWIRNGGNSVEALTVCVEAGKGIKIRITNAYGPQDYDDIDKKHKFWEYLDLEVLKSKNEGMGCLIMMDGNAWLGSKLISKDPHQQNSNGKLFENFLLRNENMTLLNGSSLCDGNITRERQVKNKKEESILDFIIVCDKLLPFVNKLVIDEEKIYSLMRYSSKTKQPIKSDHNSLILKLKLLLKNNPTPRTTRFKFKDSLAMKRFNVSTSNTKNFSKCFSTDEAFEKQTKKWMSELMSNVHKQFKKYRVTKSAPKCFKVKSMFIKRKQAIRDKEKKVSKTIRRRSSEGGSHYKHE